VSITLRLAVDLAARFGLRQLDRELAAEEGRHHHGDHEQHEHHVDQRCDVDLGAQLVVAVRVEGHAGRSQRPVRPVSPSAATASSSAAHSISTARTRVWCVRWLKSQTAGIATPMPNAVVTSASANSGRDLADAAAARHCELLERVDDAEHRAEEADEGRRRADRRERR
jgi:hypothetical protein